MLKLVVATASNRSELMADVQIRSVVKSYGESQILKASTWTSRTASSSSSSGPRAVAKSTLLRSIAGLEEVNGGELRIGGRVVNDVPPAERNIAMVFPVLRALPAHEPVRQHGVRAQARQGPKAEIEAA